MLVASPQSSLVRCALGALFALVLALPAAAAPTGTGSPAPSASASLGGGTPIPTAPSMARRKKTPPAPVQRIDINGASLKQLQTLPGIGEDEAKKIVANRPYLSKAELVHKKVLPIGPYISIKDRIIALQKKGAAKAKAKTKLETKS